VAQATFVTGSIPATTSARQARPRRNYPPEHELRLETCLTERAPFLSIGAAARLRDGARAPHFRTSFYVVV